LKVLPLLHAHAECYENQLEKYEHVLEYIRQALQVTFLYISIIAGLTDEVAVLFVELFEVSSFIQMIDGVLDSIAVKRHVYYLWNEVDSQT
jgi:hypothetical protein